MITTVLPMKAVTGELPTGEDWVFELKLDGMRILAAVEEGTVRLWSSRGTDATVRFPELQGLGGALGGLDGLLDGEVLAFGEDGRPSFSMLQHRMHVSSAAEAARRRAEVPTVFVAFDLLSLDGRDTTELAWSDRRRLLETAFEEGPSWRLSAVHADGTVLLDAAARTELEGVVAKRRDSRYRPGSRSPGWRKIKVRGRQELVVGGWIPGEGGHAGRLGSLVVGVHEVPRGPLRFSGRVGSGISEREATELEAHLGPLERPTCPFDPVPEDASVRGARWVSPTVVVEVAFSEWTPDGRLRHPSYLGRRTDVDADLVVREGP